MLGWSDEHHAPILAAASSHEKPQRAMPVFLLLARAFSSAFSFFSAFAPRALASVSACSLSASSLARRWIHSSPRAWASTLAFAFHSSSAVFRTAASASDHSASGTPAVTPWL